MLNLTWRKLDSFYLLNCSSSYWRTIYSKTQMGTWTWGILLRFHHSSNETVHGVYEFLLFFLAYSWYRKSRVCNGKCRVFCFILNCWFSFREWTTSTLKFQCFIQVWEKIAKECNCKTSQTNFCIVGLFRFHAQLFRPFGWLVSKLNCFVSCFQLQIFIVVTSKWIFSASH